MKKAFDKASDGMSFVKDGISKVQQKEWAEPLGIAMGVTAGICNGLGSFVPGLGIVGGAIQVGSKILNPAPSLADIKRSEQEILEHLEGKTGRIKDVLERECKDLNKILELYIDDNRVKLPNVESVVILNIPCWGAGVRYVLFFIFPVFFHDCFG